MRRFLIGAVLFLAACQQPPALQPPATSALAPAAQMRAEGDALMAGGQYAAAVEKFRQAIDLEPGSVPLRFALGTAYSFLDRRSEAVAQFRWVVANAAAGSTEHQEARRWLVRVGAMEEAPAAVAKADGSADAAPKADPAGRGSITGQTETSTLYILRAFDQNQDQQGYIVAITLALVSIGLLIAIEIFKHRQERLQQT